MPTTYSQYALSTDVVTTGTSGSSFSDARGSAGSGGTLANSSYTNYNWSVYNIYSGSRGGNTYTMKRTYFAFPLPSTLGRPNIASARILLYMKDLSDDSNDSHADQSKAALVRADDLSSTSSTPDSDDHDNCFEIGTSMYRALTDNVTISSTETTHVFNFNRSGLDYLEDKVAEATGANVTLTVGLVGVRHDLGAATPSLNGDYTQFSCSFTEEAGTAEDHTMEFVYDYKMNWVGHNF